MLSLQHEQVTPSVLVKQALELYESSLIAYAASIFNGDELAIEDATGGIVDVDDQHAARASTFKPIVIGAIKLNHFADARSAGAPSAMLGFAGMKAPEVSIDHALALCESGEKDSMFAFELFVGEGRTKVPVVSFDQLDGFL